MDNNKDETIKKLLNKNIDKLKEYTIDVNEGKPFFEKLDYNITEGVPIYFEPDEEERAGGGIALISRNTLSIRTEKHLKYPDPYGWNENISQTGIFQRCHAIAYRLSAKKNDKRNIFIGTANLNKKIMYIVEANIEKYIQNNIEQYIKILYRVTPQYKGKNQIPTGVLIEAQSLDKKYSICKLCYNVQEKVKINYKDGTIIEDSRGIIESKLMKKLKETQTEIRQKADSNIDLAVDEQSRTYHYENCTELTKINPKYIKEIKTKKKILREKGYSPCKICFK